MKKLFLFGLLAFFNFVVVAQGNNGKAKNKEKNKTNNPQTQADNSSNKKDKAKNNEYDRKVWEGISDPNSSCMKPSKNQPAKVRSAFQRDYPYAVNVYWTKCRGDWTASFNHGLFRSTAVYHANGSRRDTRTWTTRDNIPRRILDEILKRLPGVSVDGAIKIEVPNIVKDIFRIKNIIEGKPQYIYLDTDGAQVTYEY